MNDDEKYGSLDTLMKDLYRAISFGPGQEPDWDLLRHVFLPGGTLIPPKAANAEHAQVLTLERFIERASEQIRANSDLMGRGFREKEIARRTESYGPVVHVLSTYSGSFWNENQAATRGINSIQVLLDDGRWWVVSILWADETPDNPLPRKYLRRK